MGRRNCMRMRLCFYVTFAYEKTEDLQTGTFSSSEFYENKKTPSCIRFINAYRHTSNIQHIGTCASEVTTLWRFTNMLILLLLIIIMYTTQIGHFWGGAWPHLSKAVRTTEMKLKQNSTVLKLSVSLWFQMCGQFKWRGGTRVPIFSWLRRHWHDQFSRLFSQLCCCRSCTTCLKNVTNLILKTLTKLNRFQ